MVIRLVFGPYRFDQRYNRPEQSGDLFHGPISAVSCVSRSNRSSSGLALRRSLWACGKSQRSCPYCSLLAGRTLRSSDWRHTHVSRGCVAAIIRSSGASQVVHRNHAHSLVLCFLLLAASRCHRWTSRPVHPRPALCQTRFHWQHCRRCGISGGSAHSHLCGVRLAMSGGPGNSFRPNPLKRAIEDISQRMTPTVPARLELWASKHCRISTQE